MPTQTQIECYTSFVLPGREFRGKTMRKVARAFQNLYHRPSATEAQLEFACRNLEVQFPLNIMLADHDCDIMMGQKQ